MKLTSPRPPMRVVLTGPESTGKTTLAHALAARYDAIVAPEYARTYAERVARALGAEDVEPIAVGQQAAEDATIARARDASASVVFLDTDLVSTVVYAQHYYDTCPQWVTDAACARRADLYLLMDADQPFRHDGIRDSTADRATLHSRFRDALTSIGATVVRIAGSPEERERAAVHAIDRLLGARSS